MQPRLVERVLDMACAIQQIPAPTFSERKRALFVLEQFKQANLEPVFMDDSGNVLARIPGKGGGLPLVVSAHLDTVFPDSTDLSLRREEGKIYGPGIGDNSLGVAALLGLAWAFGLDPYGSPYLDASTHPGDIWLAANVGEEGLGDLFGMRAIVDRFKDQVRAYLVLEGMALGQIYHRALGVERYRITAQTPGGHSWVDFGKPSAIHELSKLVNKILALSPSISPRTTYNVGVISGGTSINTIASEAHLDLDLRSEGKQALQDIAIQVKSLVAAANRPGVEMSIKLIGNRPVGEIPASHPLVKLAQRTMQEHSYSPNLIIGSTDANIPLSLGYPSICVGITHGAGAHTSGEYILTEPVSDGISQLISLVISIQTQI